MTTCKVWVLGRVEGTSLFRRLGFVVLPLSEGKRNGAALDAADRAEARAGLDDAAVLAPPPSPPKPVWRSLQASAGGRGDAPEVLCSHAMRRSTPATRAAAAAAAAARAGPRPAAPRQAAPRPVAPLRPATAEAATGPRPPAAPTGAGATASEAAGASASASAPASASASGGGDGREFAPAPVTPVSRPLDADDAPADDAPAPWRGPAPGDLPPLSPSPRPVSDPDPSASPSPGPSPHAPPPTTPRRGPGATPGTRRDGSAWRWR